MPCMCNRDQPQKQPQGERTIRLSGNGSPVLCMLSAAEARMGRSAGFALFRLRTDLPVLFTITASRPGAQMETRAAASNRASVGLAAERNTRRAVSRSLSNKPKVIMEPGRRRIGGCSRRQAPHHGVAPPTCRASRRLRDFVDSSMDL